MHPRLTLAASLVLLATGCVSNSQPIPPEWLSVPEAARIRTVALADDGTVTPGSEPALPRLSDGPIRVMTGAAGATLLNGGKVLVENLAAIDSFDLSESRGEVAFSAQQSSGYDIGLVSTDGGPVHWMPSDPADEVAVQWAPRGNKISYVIRAAGGDVVRTLHIPTAFQFAIPFPGSTIHALAWDAQAERYAVAYSTIDASDRVEVLKYDGAERKVAIPPSRQLDVEVVPLAFSAVLLRPRDLHRGEKLPVVVWIADDFGWSDARAALLTSSRVAIVVTKQTLDPGLWRVLAGMAWLASEHMFVVEAMTNDFPPPESSAITMIVDDPALNASQYGRRGNIVTVPPAVVQSFAAGYIAAQLKRTTPTNGSSR